MRFELCVKQSFGRKCLICYVTMSDIFGDAGRRLEAVMYRLGRLRGLLLPFLVVLAFLDYTFKENR